METEVKKKKWQLPKELTEKWLAALRSGNFAQGTQYLARYNAADKEMQYCCLGVLGVICGCVIPQEAGVLDGDDEHAVRNLGSVPEVLTGRSIPGTLVGILTVMNDGSDGGSSSNRSHSFAEIANWIEENVELV